MNSIVGITEENQGLYLGPILEIENLSFPSPWSLNGFVQEIKNPISHLRALLRGKTLEGYNCFWMFDREIQLVNIAVHPVARNKGVASTLIKNMIESAAHAQMYSVWLEVRVSNFKARNLYEKIGFQEVGRRRGYYHDTKEDAIVMSLAIAGKRRLSNVSN